jgi:hypothetical protein
MPFVHPLSISIICVYSDIMSHRSLDHFTVPVFSTSPGGVFLPGLVMDVYAMHDRHGKSVCATDVRGGDILGLYTVYICHDTRTHGFPDQLACVQHDACRGPCDGLDLLINSFQHE